MPRKQSVSANALYGALCKELGGDGLATVETTIGELCGLFEAGRRTVQRRLAELIDDGRIETDKTYREDGGVSGIVVTINARIGRG